MMPIVASGGSGAAIGEVTVDNFPDTTDDTGQTHQLLFAILMELQKMNQTLLEMQKG